MHFFQHVKAIQQWLIMTMAYLLVPFCHSPKTLTKVTQGRTGLILFTIPGDWPLLNEVKEGNWRRSHGGLLLADLFTGCKLSGFVKHSRTTCIGNGTIHYGLGTPVSINNQDNLPRMCSWSNVIWIISQSWLYSQVTLDNVTFTVKAKQNNIYVGLGGFTVFISVSWIIFSL